MPQHEIEAFGRWLMQEVRERAIELIKEYSQGKTNTRIGRLYRDIITARGGTGEDALRQSGVIAVDLTLDCLLSAIQAAPDLAVLFSPNGIAFADIKKVSDGLAGELYGRDGWFARFGITPSQLA